MSLSAAAMICCTEAGTGSPLRSATGRTIKVRGLNQHSKTRYDRLGRAVQQFELSKDDDAANTYSDVYASGTTSVTGDTVVEQSSTGYDNTNKTGLALVRSNVSRHWNASSTLYGALDSNADGSDTTISLRPRERHASPLSVSMSRELDLHRQPHQSPSVS